MRALAGRDLEELAVAVERHGADEGVVFHSAVGDEVFVIDPGAARDRGRRVEFFGFFWIQTQVELIFPTEFKARF